MPLTNNATYVPALQQFLKHWELVNNALAPSALTLADGYTHDNLRDDLASISAQQTALVVAGSYLIEDRSIVQKSKTALKIRLKQFRDIVQGRLPSSPYAALLPTLPQMTAIETRFLRPFDAAVTLWTQINTALPSGFTGPLILPGNYTLDNFTADIAACRSRYQDVAAQQRAVRGNLQKRDSQFHAVKQRIKQYRSVVAAAFMPPNPLIDSLPRLSPVAGATPKPATDLISTYDPAQNTVHLAYTPSPSANLIRYELYFCPGPTWNAHNARKIAQKSPAAPNAFDFTLGMVNEGQTALFKIVTINKTENERGSKVVSAQRLTAEWRIAA